MAETSEERLRRRDAERMAEYALPREQRRAAQKARARSYAAKKAAYTRRRNGTVSRGGGVRKSRTYANVIVRGLDEGRFHWWRRSGVNHTCPVCGAIYSSNNHRTPPAWCSRRCADAAQAARRRNLVLVGEPFDAAEVAERDDWICQLCSRPIDPALSAPDPWSLTVDHIVPVSRDGHHSFENVQAAHWSCNSRKGNRATTPANPFPL